MSKFIEYYYAIRIGDPRRHTPYFKVRDNELTPQLFINRKEAERVLHPIDKGWRIVKVVVKQP